MVDIRSTTMGRTAVVGGSSPVGRLATRPAVTVEAAATLGEIATAMREARVSAVLIDGGDAVVTERDLVRAFEAGLDRDEAAAMVATIHPVRVPADITVMEAAAIMLNQEVRHLVVAHPDGVFTVLSLREVVAVLLQAVDPHIWLASLRLSVELPELWLG
jgi:acetyl-CoA synthetase